MEAETVNVRPQQGFIQRVVPALLPVLLVSVGYIDPGKWVANIEGGARFGYDLVAITLLFNLAAILCQYVAARISVATGRNLAQICNEEYDKWTCMFLGVQAEFSAILLDLTMVLGVAHALNLLLGVDLSTGVFLAAMDAFFFPVFASFLENGMANTVSICSAGLVLFLYVSGVLLSQSEIPFSINGVLTRLNGESTFALMGLLGASVAPHNFYIHSYFAGGSTSSLDADKSSLCQDHLFAIFCVFSGLSVVNYVLMNAAANVFHSTGLVVMTFQDAMSLMEQIFGSPLIPLVFLMLLFFSSQITAQAWAFGGEVVLHDFLKIEIPGWLHRATIRILAVAPALYCVWTCGADGIYQLLILTQVLVAIMLPSAAIPLFRIASSRQIMGVHKISQVGEFFALATLLGFLGLNVVFVVEMVFGNSDWAGGLRWNTLTGTSVQYTTLLVSSCASLCLMLWLAATPLKSASNIVEAQIWNMDVQNALSYPSVQEEETGKLETRQDEEESAVQQLESRVKDQLDTNTSVTSSVYHLPDNILMTDQKVRSCPLEESKLDVKVSSASQVTSFGEISDVKEQQTVLQSTVINEDTDKDLVVETKMEKIEPTSPVEKTVSMENNIKFIAKDVEGVSWETEEATKAASPASNFPVVSDGPPSFRSLRSEEGGSGAGSLSRLQGLGRAARRHLSAILDEFWGHLYDFHGQLVAEARAKKLDQLFGVDQKSPSPVKVDSFVRDTSSGYCLSPTAKGLESQMNSSLYDSLKQQQRTPGSIDSLYGLQRGSSPSSSPLVNRMQMLSAYGNTANNNSAYELSERRYSSLRAPSCSESREHQQPATIHGYQIKSYVDSLAKERLEALQSRGEIPTSRSMALGSLSYTQQLALALKQKSQNGLTPGPAPGFENFAGSRNISRQSERSYYGVPSSGNATDSVNTVVANEKKYSSMPDISGLSMSARNMHSPNNKSGYWDASTGGGAGYSAASYGRLSNESPLYSNLGSRVGVASGYENISQSRGGYRDAYTSATTAGTGSLWSRQPFEQFGVAERNGAVGEEVRNNRSTPINIDNNNAASTVDAEAKLLQSFRNCILKLIKLEGSEWLFGQSDGVDEELIDKVAAREKFIYEAETREGGHMGEPQISSVPNCGDGCVWRADLIVSFGVWCIHRVLDLSLMESRPELWGKYTYVLNRLQGVIDPAFSKLRTPMTPCFCLQIPASHQRASPPSASNGMLPPAARPAKGKCTTAVTLLDLIKDVEISISCRKGRTGTAAGDVAFPKGKENLASVLKRYKRRLSNKPTGMNQDGPGSRKNLNAAASVYGSMG